MGRPVFCYLPPEESRMAAALGSGARFAALSKKVHSKALAAFIGRKKYGAKKFAKLAARGRRKPAFKFGGAK